MARPVLAGFTMPGSDGASRPPSNQKEGGSTTEVVSDEEAEEATFELCVNGLAGHICTITVEPSSTILDVKAQVEFCASVPACQQRLLAEDRELGDSEVIGPAGPVPPQLTLIRRTEEQTSWIRAVKDKPATLATAPSHILADRAVVLSAVATRGWALRYAAEELRSDHEIVLAALETGGDVPRLIPAELWNDRDFVLQAMARNGYALASVPLELRCDPAVILAALAEDCDALDHVEEDLAIWTDPDFVLAAMRHNSSAIRYAGEELRLDHDFMIGAIDQSTQALPMVAMELWKDRSFVLDAVRRTDGAVRFVPRTMYSDPEVAFEALQQGKSVCPSRIDRATQSHGTPQFATSTPAGPNYSCYGLNDFVEEDANLFQPERSSADASAPESRLPIWKVVGGIAKGGILVRRDRDPASPFLQRLAYGARVQELEISNNRLWYKLVEGDGPESGWVTLRFEGRDLLVREAAPPRPATSALRPTGVHAPRPLANGPQDWKGHTGQTLDFFKHLQQSRTDTARAIHTVMRPVFSCSQVQAPAEKRFTTISFSKEDMAKEERPEDLPKGSRWKGEARLCAGLMGLGGKLPDRCRLPSSAERWEPAAAVLFLATHGYFIPLRDEGTLDEIPQASAPLISIICTTSDSRRAFHPLVYDNFLQQLHTPRELIVIHTGSTPSEFFQKKALDDPRLVYRFFPTEVDRDETPRLARADLTAIQTGAESQTNAGESTQDTKSATSGTACNVNPKESSSAMVEKGTCCDEDGTQTDTGDGNSSKGTESAGQPEAPKPKEVKAAVLCEDDLDCVNVGATPSSKHSGVSSRTAVFCWTRSLKRNVACCLARGSVIVHFDEGCLYAPCYLGAMQDELSKASRAESNANDSANGLSGILTKPAVALLDRWCTVGIADQDVHHVDLTRRELIWEEAGFASKADLEEALEADRWQHGFSFAYTRTAWERQPFPEPVSGDARSCDLRFMKAIRGTDIPIRRIKVDGLAACGWYRETIQGIRSVPPSPRQVLETDILANRGEELESLPEWFEALMPPLCEVSERLRVARRRLQQNLLDEHGPLYACNCCGFPIALQSGLKDGSRLVRQSLPSTSMSGRSRTKLLSVDVGEFTQAGGVTVEGAWTEAPRMEPWLRSFVQRTARCCHCGSQLGWRLERADAPLKCPSPNCSFQVAQWPPSETASSSSSGSGYCCPACANGSSPDHDESCARRTWVKPEEPGSWALIWRHLRGLGSPRDYGISESPEKRNRKAKERCAQGHRLQRFACGRAFSCGARPSSYICDLCDKQAKDGQQFWGCGTCDYDACDDCLR